MDAVVVQGSSIGRLIVDDTSFVSTELRISRPLEWCPATSSHRSPLNICILQHVGKGVIHPRESGTLPFGAQLATVHHR
jgi:hypothetical protein